MKEIEDTTNKENVRAVKKAFSKRGGEHSTVKIICGVDQRSSEVKTYFSRNTNYRATQLKPTNGNGQTQYPVLISPDPTQVLI